MRKPEDQPYRRGTRTQSRDIVSCHGPEEDSGRGSVSRNTGTEDEVVKSRRKHIQRDAGVMVDDRLIPQQISEDAAALTVAILPY